MGFFGPPDIRKLKADKNVRALIKALDYKKSKLIATSAAQALGKLGDKRAVLPLIKALSDHDAYLRREVAKQKNFLVIPYSVNLIFLLLLKWNKNYQGLQWA